MHFGVVLGDPRDDAVWKLDRGRPRHVPDADPRVGRGRWDAGYFNRHRQGPVRAAPLVDPHRGGAPARARRSPDRSEKSGLAVLGKDDAASWWTGRVDADRVKTPQTISRKEIGELLAAEALTAEGGALRWRQIEGRANHLFDAALLCVHSRHFRPLTASRRPFRVVAV